MSSEFKRFSKLSGWCDVRDWAWLPMPVSALLPSEAARRM